MNDSDRITNLELLFTHLERQFAELSQVVLEQAARIQVLERQIRALQQPPEDEAVDESVL
jgi:uncharacterized coiled-coil protein SlyX